MRVFGEDLLVFVSPTDSFICMGAIRTGSVMVITEMMLMEILPGLDQVESDKQFPNVRPNIPIRHDYGTSCMSLIDGGQSRALVNMDARCRRSLAESKSRATDQPAFCRMYTHIIQSRTSSITLLEAASQAVGRKFPCQATVHPTDLAC